MLPSLPGRRSHLARVLAGAAFVLAALLLAPAARAFEIATVSVSRGEDGQLEVSTRLTDPLEDRVQRSLDRGMPATLQLHAELWRRREGWFDRMEVGADAVLRLKYDAWNEEWRLERPGAAPIRTHSLDSLESALERPLVIEIPDQGRLPDDARCYVVITATLRPLNVEDVEEADDWLAGSGRDPGRGGFGVITRLPRSLFDTVRNFTGFGDSHDRARTPEFTPRALPLARR